MYQFKNKILCFIICFSSCNESNKNNNPIEMSFDDHREIKKVFYEGGGLKKKFQVNLLGQKDGLSFEYYENENIKSVSYYKNGLLDSAQNWFYPNGKKQAEIFRLQGRKFGSQKMYDSSGNLEAVYFVTSICDSCIASIIYFNPDGSIKEKDGSMLNYVYEKDTINTLDTAKIIFYVIEPNLFKTSSTLIEEQKNGYLKREGLELDFLNYNKGVLFIKKFESIGDYRIGLKVSFLNTRTNEFFEDSIFAPLKVVLP